MKLGRSKAIYVQSMHYRTRYSQYPGYAFFFSSVVHEVPDGTKKIEMINFCSPLPIVVSTKKRLVLTNGISSGIKNFFGTGYSIYLLPCVA